MTRWEQAWASEVLNAFTVEGAPGLNVSPGEVDYVGAFSRMRRGSTALASLGLRLALWMVVLAPLWLLGRVGTFSALALRDRTELLSRLLSHSSFIVRELTLLLKLSAAMALLGTASVRARTQYDEPRSPGAITQDARLRLKTVSNMNQATTGSDRVAS